MRRQQRNVFQTAIVVKSDLTETVTESGNLTTTGNVPVYSPTNGIVSTVSVQNGDLVSVGTPLFTVESNATPQEQQSAYAAYLSAQASHNAAIATANTLRADMYTKWKLFTDLATNDRYEEGDGSPDLSERESAEFQTSQDTWLAAERKYKDQQVAINAAQAQTSAAWQTYQATQNASVVASIGGVVTNLAVSPGDGVSISAIATRPILMINSTSTPSISVPVGQTDIAKVQPGQQVNLHFDAFPTATYSGKVLRVDDIGTGVQDVITYTAYISLDSPDPKLKPGMTVDAEIITASIQDALTVPNAAIKPYQGGKAVRIWDSSKNQVTYVPVRVGIKSATSTQILDGLEEGQEIILSLTNEQLQRSGLLGS